MAERGWFGVRLKEVSDEMEAMKTEWAELRQHMLANQDVAQLMKHPLFLSYPHFEQRMRRVEGAIEMMQQSHEEVRRLVRQAQQIVDSLNSRRGAG